MRIQVVKTKQEADWIASLAWACFEKQMPVQDVYMFFCFDVRDYDDLFRVWFHALREYSRLHLWSETCRQRYFRVADTGRRFWVRPSDNVDGMTSYNVGEIV